MKELQFSTGKGNFILVEDDAKLKQFIPWDLCELVESVKNMTEEQFAEVVKCSWEHNLKQYSRFTNYLNNDNSYYGSFPTAKESFESLIKSLGWYLFENPECSNQFCDNGYIDLGYNEKSRCSFCEEAEERVFENPILLKKI